MNHADALQLSFDALAEGAKVLGLEGAEWIRSDGVAYAPDPSERWTPRAVQRPTDIASVREPDTSAVRYEIDIHVETSCDPDDVIARFTALREAPGWVSLGVLASGMDASRVVSHFFRREDGLTHGVTAVPARITQTVESPAFTGVPYTPQGEEDGQAPWHG